MTDKQSLATQTASDLYTVEEACDSGIQAVAAMVNRLIDGRRVAGISVTVGHEIMAEMIDVQVNLAQARGAVIRAHKKAEALAKVWRVTADTPVDKDSMSSNSDVVRLRVNG